MSQVTLKLETVRRLYNECWTTGSFDRIPAILDPAIVWTAIESAPDAGTRRGYDECRAHMQDWIDDFILERAVIEVAGAAPSGRLGCSQVWQATGKGSGVRTEIRYAADYSFADDGRIVEVHEYATVAEALEAAGLSE